LSTKKKTVESIKRGIEIVDSSGAVRDAMGAVDLQVTSSRETFDREMRSFFSMVAGMGIHMSMPVSKSGKGTVRSPEEILKEAPGYLAYAAGALCAGWPAASSPSGDRERRLANLIIGIGRMWRRVNAEIGTVVSDAGFEAPGTLSWLNAPELLSEISRVINVGVSSGGSPDAFTYEGVVYVQPGFIAKTVLSMAKVRGIPMDDDVDLRVLSKDVVHSSLKNFLAGTIFDGYAARLCLVKFAGAKEKRMVLTPLRASAFKVPIRKLEKRKESSGLNIENVQIVGAKPENR